MWMNTAAEAPAFLGVAPPPMTALLTARFPHGMNVASFSLDKAGISTTTPCILSPPRCQPAGADVKSPSCHPCSDDEPATGPPQPRQQPMKIFNGEIFQNDHFTRTFECAEENAVLDMLDQAVLNIDWDIRNLIKPVLEMSASPQVTNTASKAAVDDDHGFYEMMAQQLQNQMQPDPTRCHAFATAEVNPSADDSNNAPMTIDVTIDADNVGFVNAQFGQLGQLGQLEAMIESIGVRGLGSEVASATATSILPQVQDLVLLDDDAIADAMMPPTPTPASGASMMMPMTLGQPAPAEVYNALKFHQNVYADCVGESAPGPGTPGALAKNTSSIATAPPLPSSARDTARTEGLNDSSKAGGPKCDWPGCGKVFSQVGNLNRHRRKHNGDRRYTCDANVESSAGRCGKFIVPCSKNFTQRSHQQSHIQICKPKKFGCDRIVETGLHRGEHCRQRFGSLLVRMAHERKCHRNWSSRRDHFGLEVIKKDVEGRQRHKTKSLRGHWSEFSTAEDVRKAIGMLDAMSMQRYNGSSNRVTRDEQKLRPKRHPGSSIHPGTYPYFVED